MPVEVFLAVCRSLKYHLMDEIWSSSQKGLAADFVAPGHSPEAPKPTHNLNQKPQNLSDRTNCRIPRILGTLHHHQISGTKPSQKTEALAGNPNSCRNALAAEFLDPDALKLHTDGQAVLQRRLFGLISEYGACTNCLGGAAASGRDDEISSYVDLPIQNFLFDGSAIRLLDYSDYQQGVGCLCIE